MHFDGNLRLWLTAVARFDPREWRETDMRIAIATTVLLTLTGSAAMANDNCAKASDQATMNECADKAFKAADADLNKLYKEIRNRLKDDADTAKLLVSAQKAWIAYRDAECVFTSAASAGGSIYPMIVSQCRDGITRKRIKDFKGYLSCEEGDMSCPVPAAQ
jgi:uncharacterized protein YecT (DUF1311 family)